jgi:tRNA(Ile)-lysidine synthase
VTTATSANHSLALSALRTIRGHGLLRGGETVLVAVSGGADSVALLDVLRELRPSLRLGLECIHVHHGLRPEADADARFVEDLCAALLVPCHVERVVVRREPPWDGLEAEARRARYRALAARAAAVSATRIATGHTADDQAETVLMRLLQGAGPRGLAGISPERGPFIRPLLEARRAEILAHLASRGLAWIEDATNRDPRFLRNRMRHGILPVLVETFGPRIVESLGRSAALCRGLVADLERRADSDLARLAKRGPDGIVLPVGELARLPGEVAAELLLRAATELGESRPRRAAAHRAIRRLLQPGAPPRAVRTGRLSMERSGAWLRVGPTRLPTLPPRRIEVPGSLALPEIGLRLTAAVVARTPDSTVPREPCRVAFDADRLPSMLDVRPRRAGDRFVPFGAPGERRLKSFLIDAGIPRWERARIPLVEAAGEIIWVAGVRRGQAAAIGPDTVRILEVTLDGL